MGTKAGQLYQMYICRKGLDRFEKFLKCLDRLGSVRVILFTASLPFWVAKSEKFVGTFYLTLICPILKSFFQNHRSQLSSAPDPGHTCMELG